MIKLEERSAKKAQWEETKSSYNNDTIMPKMKSLSDTLLDKEKPLEWRVHHFVHFTSGVNG
jgi:hypothetical protein